MYRFYYWFKGVNGDRDGGPWWFRDFNTEEQRLEFLDALEPFLFRFSFTKAPSEGFVVGDMYNTHPPKGACIEEA